jgi:hypothetical protein
VTTFLIILAFAVLLVMAYLKAGKKKRLENNAIKAMEDVNKSVMEQAGIKIEAVRQPDGNLAFAPKQIWSDEKIRATTKDALDTVFVEVGSAILKDGQGALDKAFLLLMTLRAAAISNSYANAVLTAPYDVGKMWVICLLGVEHDPGSKLSVDFKTYDDEWRVSKTKDEQDLLKVLAETGCYAFKKYYMNEPSKIAPSA